MMRGLQTSKRRARSGSLGCCCQVMERGGESHEGATLAAPPILATAVLPVKGNAAPGAVISGFQTPS
jgi:hypothetical protein